MRRPSLAHSTATSAALGFLVFGAMLDSGAGLAAEPLQLKEGLWSIHNREIDTPSNKKIEFTSTICRSHASEQRAREDAKNRKECTTINERLQGSEYTIESRCTIKGSTVESKSTTLFKGDSTHTDVHITYTPALNGITQSTLIQDQKYLGMCPAGAEPGDVMLPNGNVEHLGRAKSGSQPRP